MELDLAKIQDHISKCRKSEKKMLEYFKNQDYPSRTMIIQEQYLIAINNNSKWISNTITLDNLENDIKTEFYNDQLEDMMEKIRKNPSEKPLLINNYLQQFKEISQEDRKILIERFKTLNDEELSGEILSIIDIFR